MIAAMRGPKIGQVWAPQYGGDNRGHETLVVTVGDPEIPLDRQLLPGEAPPRTVVMRRLGLKKNGDLHGLRVVDYYRFNGKAGGFTFIREKL